MTIRRLAITFFIITLASSANAQLWVDFNSLTQDNGPHPAVGYQHYDAGHEVMEDFVTKDFEAFGTTISFTPSWPDSADNRTMQMIDRGTQLGVDEDGFPIAEGNDANWLYGDDGLWKETGTMDVVTDWIGVDTRTANGGNGDYDGEVGDPTRILFTLGGVPAGEYSWASFHHDTENIHTPFLLEYSVDGGSTFEAVGDGEFKMTNSSPGSNPPEPEVYDGADAGGDPLPLTEMPSSVLFNFDATGSDVVLQYTPLSAEAVHTQIFGINAFQLEQLSVADPVDPVDPGPICDPNTGGDIDGNGSVEFADFLVLSDSFGTDVTDGHTSGDLDCNGSVEFADFLILSNNFGTEVGAEASSVPEPSGLALFGIAGLLAGLIRRRR